MINFSPSLSADDEELIKKNRFLFVKTRDGPIPNLVT